MRRFDYKGWSRYRLSSQLEQVEEMWDKERKGRVDNSHALSDEKRIHNDLQWQLREAEQRLSAQQGAYHDLQLDYEKAKHDTEKAVESVKQVKREKRELQMKITLLTEDIRRYELDASKARFEVAASVDQVQVLRREHLADADKAGDFQNRELAFALDRLKDSEKRNKELQHTFGIERDRYEARQKAEESNIKRVQLEREYAQEELAKAQKIIDEKQKKLIEAFAEIDKLENELKHCDDELEMLHGRVLELDGERRFLKAELEELQARSSEEIKKERAQFVLRLDELRKENSALLQQLSGERASREDWLRKVRDEHAQEIRSLQVDLQVSQEESAMARGELKRIRREELKPPMELLDEQRRLQGELQRMNELLDKIKNAHEAERKELVHELQESELRSERLHKVIEELKSELSERNTTVVDEAVALTRTINKLEEKIKRLQQANDELAVERESLLVSEVHLKKQLEGDSRQSLEKLLALEIENDKLKKTKESLEFKLKMITMDHDNAKTELAKITATSEELRKEVQKVAMLEKKVELLQDQAVEREAAVKAEIDSLSEQIKSWKLKVRAAERTSEGLQHELSKQKLKERQAFDIEKQLRGQLQDTQDRLNGLEQERKNAEKAKQEVQTKLLLELQDAKNTSTDAQKKAMQSDRERDKTMRDLLDSVKAKAAEEQKELKVQHENAQRELKDNIALLQTKLERLTKELDQEKSTSHEKDGALLALKQKLDGQTGHAVEVDSLQKMYDEARIELKEQRNKFIALETEKKNLELEKTSLNGKVQRLESALREAEDKAKFGQNEQQEVVEREKKLRADLTAASSESKTLKEKIAELKNKTFDLDRENNTLQAEKAKLSLELQQAKGSESRATVLDATIERLRNEMKEKDAKATEEYRKEADERSKLARELEQLKIGFGRAVSEAERLAKSQEELKETRAKLDKRLQETTQELNQKKTALADAERQVRQFQVLAQNKTAEQSAASSNFSTEISRLNDEINQLRLQVEQGKAEVQRAEASKDELRRRYEEQDAEYKKQQEQADDDLAELAIELEQAQKDLKGKEEERAALAKQVDSLKATVAKAEEAASAERQKLTAELTKATSERDQLKKALEGTIAERNTANNQRAALELELSKAKALAAGKAGEVEKLTLQIKSLEARLVAAPAQQQSLATAEMAQLRKQLAELEDTTAAFEEDNDAMRKELEAAKAAYADAERKLANVAELQKALAAKEAEIARLQKQLAELPVIKTEEPKAVPAAAPVSSSPTKEAKKDEEEDEDEDKVKGLQVPGKDAKKKKRSSTSKLEEELAKEKKRNSELEERVAKEKKWVKEKSEYKKQVQKLQKELASLKAKDAAKTPKEKKDLEPDVKAAVLVQSLLRARVARKQFKSVHQRRFKIASEIVSTEQTYTKYLKVIVDTFISPLRALKLLSDEQLDTLFCNISELSSNNSKLREALEDRVDNWNVDQKIGDVFVKSIALLEPHAKYCQNYARATQLKLELTTGKVAPGGSSGLSGPAATTMFNQFLQIARFMPQLENKSLDDLLIMPVQRVPRYKLLLTELYEKTLKGHGDHKDLNQALNMTNKLALSINESTREAEAVTLMVELRESITGLDALGDDLKRGALDMRDKVPSVVAGAKLAPHFVAVLTDGVLFCTVGKRKKRASSFVGLSKSSDDSKSASYKALAFAQYKKDLAVSVSATAELSGSTYENVLQIGSHYIVMPTAEAAIEWQKLIKERLHKLAQ